MWVHQSIHGYENGHRQLATSLEMPRELQRIVTSQSDLSGRSINYEFDGYLTGYPLPSIGFYALARTWYAKELPRPGCVWTHTLYIDDDAIGNVTSFSAIAKLFRRPDHQMWSVYSNLWSAYSNPIELQEDDLIRQDESILHSRELVPLMASLFDDEERPIIVSSRTSEQYEDVVTSLWLLQWKSLRKTFTFSTCSLSNRKYMGGTFDLQIVPENELRHVARSVPDAVVFEKSTNLPIEQMSTQLYWYYESLLMNQGTNELIAKSMGFPKDLPSRRCIYPLAVAMPTHGSALDAFSILESFYPESSSGKHAKKVIVECLFELNLDSVFGVDKYDLLLEACSSRWSGMFDAFANDAEIRSFQAARFDPIVMTALLKSILDLPLSEFGVSVVRGIVSSLGLQQIEDMDSRIRTKLPAIVSILPEICFDGRTWSGATRQQQFEILDALLHSSNQSSFIRERTIEGILSGNAHDLARVVVRTFGEESLRLVLDWFSMHGRDAACEFPSPWIEEMRAHQELVFSWLSAQQSINIPIIAAISHIFDPGDRSIQRISAKLWLDGFENRSVVPSSSVVERAACFLLAISFRAQEPAFAPLSSRTFEIVHDLMMNREIGHDEWSWFYYEVPSLGWSLNWDRAERLRQGYVQIFVERNWQTKYFVLSVSKSENWILLLQSCQRNHLGSVLIRQLRNDLQNGNLQISPSWQNVLFSI